MEAAHGLSTNRAEKGLDGHGERQDRARGGGLIQVGSIEQEAQGSQALVVGVGEEAEVAHLHEAFGEDMLKETVDEFVGGEGTELGLVGVGRTIAEGDLVVLELHQAAVGKGNAEDIGSQIFESRASVANRFAVHDPVLFPRKGRDLRPNRGKGGIGEGGLLEGVEEFGAEDLGKGFHREQEIRVGRVPGALIGCQSASRDEVVNMGVKREVAAPGVQDAEHADLSAEEARILRQELGGSCGGAEEQVIDQGLMAACQRAQSSRDGEGEHEVGHAQEQVLLSLEPLLSLLVLAFGTVAVAAGMVAVADQVALGTGVELSAESLGAAGLNCVHSPAVRREQPVGVLLAIGGAVTAEDVGQL